MRALLLLSLKGLAMRSSSFSSQEFHHNTLYGYHRSLTGTCVPSQTSSAFPYFGVLPRVHEKRPLNDGGHCAP